MPRHDDMGPEVAIVGGEADDRFTLVGGQELLEHHPAITIEMGRGTRPIGRLDARADVHRADLRCFDRSAQATPSRSSSARFRSTPQR
jgi:hypothetical protein